VRTYFVDAVAHSVGETHSCAYVHSQDSTSAFGAEWQNKEGSNELVAIAIGTYSFSCGRQSSLSSYLLVALLSRTSQRNDRIVTSIPGWDWTPPSTTLTGSNNPSRHPLRRSEHGRRSLATPPLLIRSFESPYASDTSIPRVGDGEELLWSVHPLLLRPTTSRR
jgi:hypothetical protein